MYCQRMHDGTQGESTSHPSTIDHNIRSHVVEDEDQAQNPIMTVDNWENAHVGNGVTDAASFAALSWLLDRSFVALEWLRFEKTASL